MTTQSHTSRHIANEEKPFSFGLSNKLIILLVNNSILSIQKLHDVVHGTSYHQHDVAVE